MHLFCNIFERSGRVVSKRTFQKTRLWNKESGSFPSTDSSFQSKQMLGKIISAATSDFETVHGITKLQLSAVPDSFCKSPRALFWNNLGDSLRCKIGNIQEMFVDFRMSTNLLSQSSAGKTKSSSPTAKVVSIIHGRTPEHETFQISQKSQFEPV